MKMPDYAALAARIALQHADDLDDLLCDLDGRAPEPGRDVFPELEAVLLPEPAFKREDGVCIGVRADGGGAEMADLAMRLAAMAVERDVEVIVLSEADASGLGRFGFRVERIPARTDPAHAEWVAQVRRFWNLDLVLR